MASQADLILNIIARDKASATILKSGLAIAAVSAGLVKFAKDSVKAYSESEDAQNRLSFAYQKFPKLADVTKQSLDDLSQSLQKKTVFDDEATKSAEAVLAQFNLTGKQVEKLIPLVQDYAAATGQDLLSATTAVGKAFEGNARALKAVGIDFHATGDTAKDFATIQADLNEKVGGFAEKQGKTAAGQAKILANQYNELQEKVGSLLVPALSKLVGIVTPLVEDFLKLPGPLQSATVIVVGLGAAAVLIIPQIAKLKTALVVLGISGKGVAGELTATAAAETEVGLAADASSAKVAAAGGRYAAVVGILSKLAGALAVAAYLNGLWDKSTNGLLVHLRDVGGREGNLYDAVSKTNVQIGDSVGAYSILDRLLHRTADTTREQVAAVSATIPAYRAQVFYIGQSVAAHKDIAEAVRQGQEDLRFYGSATAATSVQVRSSALAYKDFGGDIRTAGAEAARASEAQRDAAASATVLAGAAKFAAAAAREQATAIAGLIGSLHNATIAGYDAADAMDAAKESIRGMNRDGKQTGKEVRDAMRGILDAAEKVRAKFGDTKRGNDAYLSSLEALRRGVKPGSPLWQALTAYILKLKSIPAEVATRLKLYTVTVASGQAAHVAKTHGFASGGYIPARPGGTLINVGEGGKGEYVVPEDKMRTHGGSTVNNITINTKANPDDVVRAIQLFERRSGARWRR